MYSRILSKEQLGKVVSASPDARFAPIELARAIWEILQGETVDLIDAQKMEFGGQVSYHIHVKHIARRIDGSPSPCLVGRVIHDMGLDDYRRNDGFVVTYNAEQLAILANALEVVQ